MDLWGAVVVIIIAFITYKLYKGGEANEVSKIIEDSGVLYESNLDVKSLLFDTPISQKNGTIVVIGVEWIHYLVPR